MKVLVGYPNKGRETNPHCLSPSHHHGWFVCLLPFNTCPVSLGLYLQWLPVRLGMIQIPCSVLQDLGLPAWPLLSFTAFSSARSSEPNPSPPQDCKHCLLLPLLREFFPIYHRAPSSAGSSCKVWSGYPVAGSHNPLAGLVPLLPCGSDHQVLCAILCLASFPLNWSPSEVQALVCGASNGGYMGRAAQMSLELHVSLRGQCC